MILTVFSGLKSAYTVKNVKIPEEIYPFMLSPGILSTIKITKLFLLLLCECLVQWKNLSSAIHIVHCQEVSFPLYCVAI